MINNSKNFKQFKTMLTEHTIKFKDNEKFQQFQLKEKLFKGMVCRRMFHLTT